MDSLKKAQVLFAAIAWLGLSSCDNAAKQPEKAKTTSDKETDASDTGSGNAVADETAPSDTGGGSKAFETFCEKAAETDVAKDQLQKYFAVLCDGTKPTAMLTKTLIDIAYSGSGDPKFKLIEKFASDKDSKTTGYLGVGIKLPISIKDHFDKVGPKGGDVASLKKLAEAQNAVGEVEIQEKYKDEGKYEVRGWKIRSKNTKDIVITKIVTEVITRSDEFMLDEGNAYLYTQYTLKSLQGIKDLSLLTAGIKDGSDSYLITIAFISADNKGLPQAAEDQIKGTAKALIKSMYQAAKDAK